MEHNSTVTHINSKPYYPEQIEKQRGPKTKVENNENQLK